LCSGKHGIYWSGLAWNKWHFRTTRYSLHIHLTTFNVQILGLDIFTEIYTCTLNDLFHTVVKTNKINNIQLQLLKDKKIQELSIQIGSKSNSKQQTDLVNNLPQQCNHKPFFHFWTKIKGSRHDSSKKIFLNYSSIEGTGNKFVWWHFTIICNPM
jgi:hypothetical protein